MRLRGHLRGIAIGMTGSREEADDVLQDAFCKLWMGHKGIEREIDVAKLSYTSVRNSAIDVLRHRNARHSVSDECLADMTSDSESDADCETDEIYSAVLYLSRKVLNDRQYQVFMMHDVENITYPEIARSLGLSQENVRAILSRARKTIREVYRKRYE